MYPAINVANYIIYHEHRSGREISNLRLQKLLYFVQAKFLVEKGSPCFIDAIHAWTFGPVVLNVYHTYKLFGSNDIATNIHSSEVSVIRHDDRVLIDDIIDFFAPYPSYQLVDITHQQDPWRNAISSYFKVITPDAIVHYFNK